jgi:double-stranded uracil-DNA glycosylase
MIKYQIGYGLKILFIGINPHPGSYSRGVPFSHNKMFWYLLHDAGLLPQPRELLKDDAYIKKLYLHSFKKVYRFGLLNIVDRPTRTAAEIKNIEALPGKKRLLATIKKYQPLVVCFIGKKTYELFIKSSKISYGWHPAISLSKIYVMHSPNHGLARIRIKELKEISLIKKKSQITMAKNFKVGDHVSWNSEAGRVSGIIKKKITAEISFKGYTVHASAKEPQYVIQSDKTDHMAMHKGSALKKIKKD